MGLICCGPAAFAGHPFLRTMGTLTMRLVPHLHPAPCIGPWIALPAPSPSPQLLHPEVRMLFMRLVHHGPDSHEYVYSDLNVRQARPEVGGEGKRGPDALAGLLGNHGLGSGAGMNARW